MDKCPICRIEEDRARWTLKALTAEAELAAAAKWRASMDRYEPGILTQLRDDNAKLYASNRRLEKRVALAERVADQERAERRTLDMADARIEALEKKLVAAKQAVAELLTKCNKLHEQAANPPVRYADALALQEAQKAIARYHDQERRIEWLELELERREERAKAQNRRQADEARYAALARQVLPAGDKPAAPATLATLEALAARKPAPKKKPNQRGKRAKDRK
jgi:hypothetical protein